MAIPRSTLAIAGTVAVHMVIVVVMDLAQRLADEDPEPRPKPLPLVKLPAAKAPPPPAVEPPPLLDLPPPPPPTTTPPKPTRRAPPRQVATTPPSPTPVTTTADPPPTSAAPGGAPVVTLPGVTPSAVGVPVAVGKPPGRRTGQGGEGGGTGSGTGPGSGPPVAKVVSVASIKKMAVPKGDYDYFDAARQYPAEARQLGVGGVVRVQLTIDDKGKVVKARLLGKGLGHGLDELALTRARALQFDPALDTEDRPVTSVLTWTFRFEVPS